MPQESSGAKAIGQDWRRIMVWAALPLLILLVPLITMQVTDEVQWSLGDFLLAGALLAAAGLAYAILAPKRKPALFRGLIGLVVLIVTTLIWMELAVGIFS